MYPRRPAFLLAALLLATTAAAQSPRPQVALHPLQLKRAPRLTEAELKGLTAEYVRLVIANGARPADALEVEQAIETQHLADCERGNPCLAALANATRALYAMHVALDQDVTRTRVTATGRLVRDDGQLVGTNGQDALQVTLELGKQDYLTTARAALAQLVDQLGPGLLPVSRSTTLVPELARAAPGPASPSEPLSPAPPAPAAGSGLRTGGFVALGAGVAMAVGGGVALALAQQDRAQLTTNASGAIPESQLSLVEAATGKERAGIGMLIGAGVAAVAGGVLLVVAPSAPAQATVVPVPGGALLAVGGTWP